MGHGSNGAPKATASVSAGGMGDCIAILRHLDILDVPSEESKFAFYLGMSSLQIALITNTDCQSVKWLCRETATLLGELGRPMEEEHHEPQQQRSRMGEGHGIQSKNRQDASLGDARCSTTCLSLAYVRYLTCP